MTNSDYEPNLNLAVWNEVKRFVLDSVADAADGTPYTEAELKVAASRIAAWTWQTAGLPLERGVVFRRDVVARFIAVGCSTLKPASRGNLRSQLLRMSEVLLDPREVPRRLAALESSEPAAPYSGAELISLRSWASTQSTPARRANAWVLLATGAGAGLAASEIGELRVGDIRVDGNGVLLVVTGERPRVVPVLREWEQVLADRTRTLGPDRFAFRENHAANYPNLIANFIDRSQVVGVKPKSQRLRATWIVRHLDAATPVVPLMQAAGIESLEAMTRYVRFVREVDDGEARTRLREA
ncbi:site-specific integrase [Cryobacterium sp. HLT2-28]|uniref:site-specific integrase n=1 Tax=Cryobacterium sp. HLT2-28 TaxID=1259146 RepID=UPI00106D7981|nr:site-specific integrase [Cryobacterium sp. HLT2-28]TFB91463.1 site-specific integrase [Cryobacterium sp. HLT2-28]